MTRETIIKKTIYAFRFSFFWLLFPLLFACSSPAGQGQETASAAPDSVARAASPSPETPEPASQERIILFFGNSLTAGYGIELSQAFPALIQRRIDSLGLGYRVVNAGLSGETTASGKNRIGWLLNRRAEILVIELGANDGLRGIPVPETRKNLEEMIATARGKYPDIRILLCGMEVPPNMGPDYQKEFRSIFKDLAIQKNAALVPFLLADVVGEPDLNLADGIHPTPAGHKIVAENVWQTLSGMLVAR